MAAILDFVRMLKTASSETKLIQHFQVAYILQQKRLQEDTLHA